jgi:dihydrofolate reductase
MAKLIYSGIMSLDGYIADQAGKFDWSMPDTEVHTAVNDLTRSVGTFLLGRRMYEVLVAWETMDVTDQETAMEDFANIWRAADKVVYSGTLNSAPSARTRIERIFNPDEVRRMKADAERDIAVGGPTLAAHAINAGLVDEYHLFVNPVVVGGGKSYLADNTCLRLKLLDERRFSNGVVLLRYASMS